MPNKIKSKKQLKFLEGIAHGMKTAAGPSKDVASEMVSNESKKKKSMLMRGK